MRRAALAALLVAGALLLQLTAVNRLHLPGGGGPDLLLLVVIALALCGGPQAGMLTGFCAGLSLDLAPPASQLIGEYALVFCVVGYGCGKLRGALGRSALPPLVAGAAAAAAGEALYAGLGLVLDPARVTSATVRQVLPPSVLYDVLISPPVTFLVMLASRWVNDRAGLAGPASRSQQPGSRPARARAGRPRTHGFHPARSTASWSAGAGPRTVRPGAGRPARSPAFRPGRAVGVRPGRAVGFRPGREVGLRPGRAIRLRPGRRSAASTWALGRAGRRSKAWRIGGRRAGGSR